MSGFKTSSWQSGGAIQANRESEVITALEATEEHSQSYVRLIGIDPKAKRSSGADRSVTDPIR